MVKKFYLVAMIFMSFLSCKKEKDFDFFDNQELYRKSAKEILDDSISFGTLYYFNAPKTYLSQDSMKFKNTLKIISRFKVDMIDKERNGGIKFYFLDTEGINTEKKILYYSEKGNMYISDNESKLIKRYNNNWSEIYEKKFNY